jgi:hypothetical protein
MNLYLQGLRPCASFPVPPRGEVVRTWTAGEFDYKEFSDGRIYRRDVAYVEHSPYGWMLVLDSHTL